MNISSDRDHFSEEEGWSTERTWRPETVTKLVTRAIQEFKEGRFDRDFEDKLADRGIPLQTILDTISSKRTYIVKYYDHFDGTRRIGFWHPRIQVFVAWKPGRKSQFKTGFRKRRGIEYMQNLPGSALIYRKEG